MMRIYSELSCVRKKLSSDLQKISQNAYLTNTKLFPKTKFWTCFGTPVPPFRAGVYVGVKIAVIENSNTF